MHFPGQDQDPSNETIVENPLHAQMATENQSCWDQKRKRTAQQLWSFAAAGAISIEIHHS